MSHLIRVGLVGLGEVAQIEHLPVLESLSDRFRVTAVCDIAPSLVTFIADRYHVAGRYLDYRELCRDPEVDVVFVLNPDEYHTETVLAALDAGKHVFVEKPMCLTLSDADRIIERQQQTGKTVMVGYMRRYAPAFQQACEAVRALDKVNYVRVRDIMGGNRLVIDQACSVFRPTDVPPEAVADRRREAARQVTEAIGDAPESLQSVYRLLCGLNSHDLSALREMVGRPARVAGAAVGQHGQFLNVLMAYDGFYALLETGVDRQRRNDVHIAVYAPDRTVTVQYDTPYIRHLPTVLTIEETVGEAYRKTVTRPTYTDNYTWELKALYDHLTQGTLPKTGPEDFREDLVLFRRIIDTLRAVPA
jgi:predicted dehydrogenase